MRDESEISFDVISVVVNAVEIEGGVVPAFQRNAVLYEIIDITKFAFDASSEVPMCPIALSTTSGKNRVIAICQSVNCISGELFEAYVHPICFFPKSSVCTGDAGCGFPPMQRVEINSMFFITSSASTQILWVAGVGDVFDNDPIAKSSAC